MKLTVVHGYSPARPCPIGVIAQTSRRRKSLQSHPKPLLQSRPRQRCVQAFPHRELRDRRLFARQASEFAAPACARRGRAAFSGTTSATKPKIKPRSAFNPSAGEMRSSAHPQPQTPRRGLGPRDARYHPEAGLRSKIARPRRLSDIAQQRHLEPPADRKPMHCRNRRYGSAPHSPPHVRQSESSAPAVGDGDCRTRSRPRGRKAAPRPPVPSRERRDRHVRVERRRTIVAHRHIICIETSGRLSVTHARVALFEEHRCLFSSIAARLLNTAGGVNL